MLPFINKARRPRTLGCTSQCCHGPQAKVFSTGQGVDGTKGLWPPEPRPLPQSHHASSLGRAARVCHCWPERYARGVSLQGCIHVELDDVNDKVCVCIGLLAVQVSASANQKSRRAPENICFCSTDHAKGFDCVHHHKLWRILKVMGIPDHPTCLLRNL